MGAELLKLMTHSSTPKLWKEEGNIFKFYQHLCSRGYLKAVLFREVTWIRTLLRRSELLKGSRHKESNVFFEIYQVR